MGLSSGVRITFSQPQKPNGQCLLESFHRTSRAKCLNAHRFTCLTEVQSLVETCAGGIQHAPSQRSCREETQRIRQGTLGSPGLYPYEKWLFSVT